MTELIQYEKYLQWIKEWEARKSENIKRFAFLVQFDRSVRVANYLRNKGYKVTLTKYFAPNANLSKIEIEL